MMSSELLIRVFNVEHGACAMLGMSSGERIAMIDCGHNDTTGWRPSTFIKYQLGLTRLDYLFITNADQDHLSDLDGLWLHGVEVGVLHRNPTPSSPMLRVIKEQTGGELTGDMERYLQIHRDFVAPVSVPFELGMGGVTYSMFYNRYPWFTTTNNLSLAVFIKYGPFKMLFPGDLEEDGWKSLLAYPPFVQELAGTTILMASHHGRKNGFCKKIFNHFTPQAVVISDKPVAHLTQDVDYAAEVDPVGVNVINQTRRRHVLTTRRDGDILFRVAANGFYSITTENGSNALRAA